MIIYFPNDKKDTTNKTVTTLGSVDVLLKDDSYTYSGIKSIGYANLAFSLPEYVDFPVGCYADIEGVKYTLTCPQNVTMNHSRNYDYTLMMYDDSVALESYILHNYVDHRLKFFMTDTPRNFIKEIVDNLNEREGKDVWRVGDSMLDAPEKTISFSCVSLKSALDTIADEFDTEWYVIDHSIYLRKMEFKNEKNPLTLSYGKGNGFVSGVRRDNDSSSRAVYRLYVQGGDRNISSYTDGKVVQSYGSEFLMLPADELEYTYNGRTYRVSKDRYYIYDVSRGDTGHEETYENNDIYPKWEGTVSGVKTTVTEEGTLYDIYDETIPPELNFNDYQVNDKPMTVIFQSGMLSGREFEVSEYEHLSISGQGGCFKLISQEYEDTMMPGQTWIPAKNDKYSVFGCALPKIYLRRDTVFQEVLDDKGAHLYDIPIDGTGAEWDLFKEACRQMYDNQDQKYSFTGTLDTVYVRENWSSIGSYIRPGGYIRFKAPFTTEAGEDIRITGIKRNVNQQYKIELTLSNGNGGSSLSTELDRIKGQEVIITETGKEAIRYAKRRYRDAIETQNMLNNALIQDFSESVFPITVQTMQMVAGSSQFQFDFIIPHPDTDAFTVIDFPQKWDKENKTLTLGESIIRHYTFGNENNVLSASKSTDFKVKAPDSPLSLSDEESDKAYYIYIVHPIGLEEDNQKIAFYEPTLTAHPYQEDGKYYFLVGILNSENDGDRGFTKMHGFTEITPGRITTDTIVSRDGKSYFNLLQNSMQLENEDSNNRLTWHDGELKIVGKLQQIGTDNELHNVGTYRGKYSSTETYYEGDIVTESFGGELCTYRCIIEDTTGNSPVDSPKCWAIAARGAKGDDGLNGQDGKNGQDGIAGAPGAPIIFRGEWDKSKEYYGTSSRLDIVKYGESYYVTTIESGIIEGSSTEAGAAVPGIDERWVSFGAQFDSIATGLLFADTANIGGWYIVDNRLGSEDRKVFLDGNTGQIILSDQIYLDQTGINLYNEDGDLRAMISKDKIDGNLQLGLSKLRYPVSLTTTPKKNLYICGYGSSYEDRYPTQQKFSSDNLWNSGNILSKGCICTIKKLKAELIFNFIKNSDHYAAFSSGSIRVTPVINGVTYSSLSKSNPRFMVVDDSNKQVVTVEWTDDIIKTYTGTNKVATIGFIVELLLFDSDGWLNFNCDITGRAEEFIVERITDQMTVIAPNGFYSYTGNNNSILLSGDRVELTGGVGPMISSGEYALKVTPNGIFVTNKLMDGEEKDKWTRVLI